MVLAHHPHVVAGAAGHDVDAAHIFEKILAEGKILKDDFPLPDARGETPAQGLRLLHDLLEHEVLDVLGHHLGVGLRGEGGPLVHEEGLQLSVILDDPVVDHGNLSAAAHLGVGVDVAGGPVGGPDDASACPGCCLLR